MTTAITTETRFFLNAQTIKEIKGLTTAIKKTKIPAFNTMKFEIINSTTLNVQLTDGDTFIEQDINSEILNGFGTKFLIPLTTFKDIKYIKKNEWFEFTVKDSNLLLNREGFVMNVNLFPTDEFPSFNFLKEDQYKMIETNNYDNTVDLIDKDKITRACKTTSKVETRPILTTVELREGKITSTDSHRLYQAETNIKTTESVTLPNDIIKAMQVTFDKKESFKLSYNDYRIKIESTNKRVYTNKQEGNYPMTDRLFPEMHNYEIKLNDVKPLYDFVKAIKGKNKNNVMDIKMNCTKNTLDLKVKTDNGNYEMEVPATFETYDNAEYDLALSFSFLKEMLEQMDKQPLTMKVVTNMRPITFNKQNDNSEVALILPVRIIK